MKNENKEETKPLRKELTGEWATVQMQLAIAYLERVNEPIDRDKIKQFIIAYLKKRNKYPECDRIIYWFHFRNKKNLQ